MSAITRFAVGATTSDLKRVKFRSHRKPVHPEVFDRHTKATLLAFQLHETREAALVYLNNPQAPLGGRPIDVAGDSSEGLDQVIADLEGRRRHEESAHNPPKLP